MTRPGRLPSAQSAPGDELHCCHNRSIYCASIEPETLVELAARRKVLPAGYDAASPIRRPREFARALGVMAAEQAGPGGRIVLLRNTVDGKTFRTAHKSQAAEPIVRLLYAVLRVPIADVRVGEGGFIVFTAELRGDNSIEASIAVEPDGTCAGKISAGDTHFASRSRDVRSFEQVLKNRLAEDGVYPRESASNG